MKNYLIELKWGLIFVIMMLIWMYLENAFGLHGEHIADHAIYTNFVAIPSILVYVFALLEKRKRFFDGKMTWLQGFKSGMLITAVVVILTPFSQFVTHEFITPEFFGNMKAHAVDSNMMSAEEAADYFNFKSYLIQSFIGALIMGAITSALVAIFVKKTK